MTEARRPDGSSDPVEPALWSKRLSTLERAYQLARSGTVTGVDEIKAKLRAEKYEHVAAQLYGRSLVADLRRICTAARRGNVQGEDRGQSW
jgi:hypothetical protein